MRPKITNVKLWGKPNNGFICWASVCMDGNFIVEYIRIIKNKSGKIIVAMPSRKSFLDEHKFVDYVHPANKEYRKYINLIVLRAYLRARDLGANISDGYIVKFKEKRPI